MAGNTGPKIFVLDNVPEGYLTIGSALGQDKPRQILIAPALMGGHSNAVLELGYINPIDEKTYTLLEQIAELNGITFSRIGAEIISATLNDKLDPDADLFKIQ